MPKVFAIEELFSNHHISPKFFVCNEDEAIALGDNNTLVLVEYITSLLIILKVGHKLDIKSFCTFLTARQQPVSKVVLGSN